MLVGTVFGCAKEVENDSTSLPAWSSPSISSNTADVGSMLFAIIFGYLVFAVASFSQRDASRGSKFGMFGKMALNSSKGGFLNR